MVSFLEAFLIQVFLRKVLFDMTKKPEKLIANSNYIYSCWLNYVKTISYYFLYPSQKGDEDDVDFVKTFATRRSPTKYIYIYT